MRMTHFHVLMRDHIEVAPLGQKRGPTSSEGISDFFDSVISL